jgi:hypothetical protein
VDEFAHCPHGTAKAKRASPEGKVPFDRYGETVRMFRAGLAAAAVMGFAAPAIAADGQRGKPPKPPESVAFAERNWTPTEYDTCPKSLHRTHAVVGSDGKRYPGWHPPTVIDPKTGKRCRFGHEHGRRPQGSDIYEWVAKRLGSDRYPRRRGIPFGSVSEQLDAYAEANPGTPTRHEDHVGHKIDWANDVQLRDRKGRYIRRKPGAKPVECDYLFKVHQGTHSPDATANNAHELIYAARCTDGARLIASTMSRFGAPNEFNRSCAPDEVVATTGSSLPAGPGERLIPDRACAETYVLVDPDDDSAYSDLWSFYENWRSENDLSVAGGERLATYDPWFAVFNPARYFNAPAGIGRTVGLSWEIEPNGDVANRPPWTRVSHLDPFAAEDPRSPFDGAQREFYVHDTRIANKGGPRRWYTDPWGANGSTEPFPGAVCQIVGKLNTRGYPELRRRLFRRGTDYGGGGVHAPN